jgi:hypothetical protein
VNRRKLLDRSDLYDHRILDNQIQSVAAIKPDAFVNDRQRFLLFDFQTQLSQFKTKQIP